jgi:DTW domain-containing protein YfiP
MHRSLCICALLPRLETRTRVVLLLHQLEIVKPTNTGVVAARCLANSAVVYRGRAPDEPWGEPPDEDANAAPVDESGGGPSIDEQTAQLAAAVAPGTRPAFLFPHPSATPLTEWRGDPPVTLIVPDGTWSQSARARSRLGRALGWPCVSLPLDQQAAGVGVGRLRTPTRPGRLATLEALAFALGVLEGSEIEAELMRVYRIMTDRTLWTNGRLPREAVTGGVPEDVRSHDPLGERPARRTLEEP